MTSNTQHDNRKLQDIEARLEADKLEYNHHGYDQSIRDREYLLSLVRKEAHAAVFTQVSDCQHPTAATLQALPPGSRVADATGDLWFKLEDGRWSFRNVTTSGPAQLVDVFGPVRIVPGSWR